jgi:protease-4
MSFQLETDGGEEMTNQQNQPISSAAGNRTAAWAIAGVLIGFALPVFLCLCLTLTTFLGLGAAFGGSAAAASTAAPRAITPGYVSGPLVGPTVALIDVNGVIVSGEAADFDFAGNNSVAASGNIVKLIKQAAKDPQVKAIVLRVDSPGGSVIGSDEIYHALKESGKPVVAQMGELAASGGYYVSMAADHIVAYPDTLTGSIGVISQFTNYEELFNKLGLKVTTIKTGENKDFGSPTTPFTEEDEKLWQQVVDEAYDNFVNIIADNRGMTKEEVKALADGRVYTGRQALSLKLVDELGYLEDAIDKAASLGGITGEPRVVQYRRQTPFSALLGQAVVKTILNALGIPTDALAGKKMPTLEYR